MIFDKFLFEGKKQLKAFYEAAGNGEKCLCLIAIETDNGIILRDPYFINNYNIDVDLSSNKYRCILILNNSIRFGPKMRISVSNKSVIDYSSYVDIYTMHEPTMSVYNKSIVDDIIGIDEMGWNVDTLNFTITDLDINHYKQLYLDNLSILLATKSVLSNLYAANEEKINEALVVDTLRRNISNRRVARSINGDVIIYKQNTRKNTQITQIEYAIEESCVDFDDLNIDRRLTII